MPFLFELLPFPYLLAWRRLPTCDRCEIGERQRIFSTVGEHSVLPCPDIFAASDKLLLHMWVHLRRARHSSAARFVSALLQTGSTRINCTKCLIRRCRALQRAKELRNTGMLRLRKLTHMCSRTVSDLANRFRKTRKKKSSAVPLFRSSHMSAICARLGSKGKVGVQRGRALI